jgi:FHA domain
LCTARHNGRVRFEVSKVLDAIERRLSIDPAVAAGVVDLTEITRLGDLDGGRPANLLRLGLVVDALGQRLGDNSAATYVVADRALMSDTELTSNERMVIRRWSDDGLIEVLPAGTPVVPRVREISALTGMAMITRVGGGSPAYAPVPSPGGINLIAHAGQLPVPPTRPNPVLGRQWTCPEFECSSFGQSRVVGQPPPAIRNGIPTCPRHGKRLTDAGPRAVMWPMVVRVDGLVRHRFAVAAGGSVMIGRAPEGSDVVAVGPFLDEAGIRWVSRNHARLELRDDGLRIADTSTNGTTLVRRTGPTEPPVTEKLAKGQRKQMGEWDVVVLYEGVEIGRADRLPARSPAVTPSSVMADAPTQALRISRPGV